MAEAILRILLLIAILIVTFCQADVFTATDRMSNLIKVETKLLQEVKSYIDAEYNRGREVDETWEKEYSRLKQLNDDDSKKENFAENPLNSYHLLHRMTQSWQQLIDYIVCPDCEPWQKVNSYNVTAMYESIKKSGSWPTNVDCRGAGLALIRLAEVYDLDVLELIQGRIYDTQTNPLTDEEVFRNIKYAEDLGLTYECLKWLKAGLQRALDLGKRKMALKYYSYTASFYYSESMPWKSREVIEEALDVYPHQESLKRDLDFYTSKCSKVSENDRNKKVERVTSGSLIMQDYEKLCSDRLQNKKRGMCQYRKTRIPVYQVKEEILSNSPRISMFYDVIFEHEIQRVKDLSLEKLSRSQVEGMLETDIRISQSAWLDDIHPEILRLTHRIELITGLSLESRNFSTHAESLQVLNYGIGGMYEPHYDFFNHSSVSGPHEATNLLNAGDRLATFLFYLNDVKAGGATVFPDAKVRVPVVKGAAAFWYNLKQSSFGDEMTRHGGCPVLLGSKWVCNKWIRFNGNMFTAKCGKNPAARFGTYKT